MKGIWLNVLLAIVVAGVAIVGSTLTIHAVKAEKANKEAERHQRGK